MSAGEKVYSGTRAFMIDYIQRHTHPVNAILHVFGVPMAFTGLFFLLSGRFASGAALFSGGYFLQYLGHRAQGNEVGEVTLIKAIYRRLTAAGRS